MRHRPLRKIDEPVLVNAYGRIAAAHAQAAADEDEDRAAPLAQLLAELCHELKRRDRGGALLDLLDDPNPHVRVWVASHVLDLSPEPAEAALQEVVAEHGDDRAGRDASWALEAWREGRLEFP